jgi:hypothetical protein
VTCGWICHAVNLRIGLVLAAAACADVGSANHQTRSEAAAQVRPVNGWGPLQFEMNLQEAVAALPTIKWNSVSLRECREEMAFKGCFLVSDKESSSLPTLSGISFAPNLTFDRRGRLTKIDLGYDRERRGTSEQCLEVFETAASGVAAAYGTVTEQPAGPRTGKNSELPAVRRSPAGLSYTLHYRLRDGTYVSPVLRSHAPSPVPREPRAAAAEWDRRSHVSLMSTFLFVDGRPYCLVNVDYHLGTGGRGPEVGKDW